MNEWMNGIKSALLVRMLSKGKIIMNIMYWVAEKKKVTVTPQIYSSKTNYHPSRQSFPGKILVSFVHSLVQLAEDSVQ